MASQVEIVNNALIRLGAKTISAMTDNQVEARYANTIYDHAINAVLAEGEWSNAIFRAELTKLVDAPVFGFAAQFTLPTSPAIVRIVGINEQTPGTYSFRRGNYDGAQVLEANLTDISLKYIGEIANAGNYGVHITESMIARLAAELAYPLTGNQSTSQNMWNVYKTTVAEQLALDGQQGSKDVISSDDLTRDR